MAGQLNNLSIRFDAEGMTRDLIAWCDQKVIIVATRLASTLNSMDYEYASGTFKDKLIEHGRDQIKIQVGSDHWYSYIVEYGKGPLMDINNPGLSEYIGGRFWNPYRVHGDFRSWGNVVYTVPDWEGGSGFITRQGRGRAGIKLPKEGAEGSIAEKYMATPPKHFLQNAMENTKKILEQEIRSAIRSFPFQDYLKGGV